MIKQAITTKDKEIINQILLFICNYTETENDCAAFIESNTGSEITKEEFHKWLPCFDIDSISAE